MSDKVYTFQEIREKMAAYCAYQDRCHQEVDKKLNTFHLIPEAREEILLYLMRENFLNEERFALAFVKGKFKIKKWGRIRLKAELKKRKISNLCIYVTEKQNKIFNFRIW